MWGMADWLGCYRPERNKPECENVAEAWESTQDKDWGLENVQAAARFAWLCVTEDAGHTHIRANIKPHTDK